MCIKYKSKHTFSTAARLVTEYLEFCTSRVEHSDYCCFTGVTYVALTLCFKMRIFYIYE